MSITKINQATDINKSSVIGTYEGECADANITNENGLDITREVWENTFNSDDFKKALSLGWYIGFLGHPEDPECMDFKNGCIVMTEGHIDPNGKVYGKFNLIDTPVGRIVKSFIDAGVKFGISVRGVGDIENNSVDPETFVFRGFDLVSFPAFPESIPKFTEIAASTDMQKRKAYKKVCASITENLPYIDDIQAIDVIQEQFAPQSETYSELEDRKSELLVSEEPVIDETIVDDAEDTEVFDKDEYISLLETKIESLTDLYTDAILKCKELESHIENLDKCIAEQHVKSIDMDRKLNTMEDYANKQYEDYENVISSIKSSHKSKITAMAHKYTEDRNNILAEYTTLKQEYDSVISENEKLKKSVKNAEKINLNYRQKLDTKETKLSEANSEIEKLNTELSETVRECEQLDDMTSNLDAELKRTRQTLNATKTLLREYQEVYANFYAKSLGSSLHGISINSSTHVQELRSMIEQNTNNLNFNTTETEFIDEIEDTSEDDGTLVVL